MRRPEWHNAPVTDFGRDDARLLIVGLAPGAAGANRTGRPFTGDAAGELFYSTLAEFGFSKGVYDARPDDGLELVDCLVANAVRCVPPQNKPLAAEIATCNRFLVASVEALPKLRCIVALGRVAHDGILRALSQKPRVFAFAHGREHRFVADMLGREITLIDSYHCSRLNTNTGALTPEMFRAVFARARAMLEANSE